MKELNVVHASTTDSFRAGLEDFPVTECDVCGHKSVHADWVGSVCDTCGADTAWDNLPDYIREIRKKTGLTRKQIAEKLGYKHSTVKNYEFTKVTGIYWVKFKCFINDFYKQI